jgi:streptogramin lyase
VRVDPDTGEQNLYSPIVIGAIAAAVDPDGSVLVVTQAGTNGRLVRFTDPAQEPAELLLAGNAASGRALNSMNEVEVAEDGTIVLLGFAYEEGSTALIRSILALPPGPSPALRFVSADSPQGGIATGRDGSLYIASSSGLRRVDPQTGAYETVAQGGSIPRPTDAVVEGDGRVLVLNNADAGGARGVVRVDPDTGAQDVLAENDLFFLPRRIALGADGAAYVAGGDEVIIRVDPVTGAQTAASSEGLLDQVYDVAGEASGTLLALDLDIAVDRLIRIDPGTPSQTLVGPPIYGSSPHFGPNQSSDIAITPDGTPYAILLGDFGGYELRSVPLAAGATAIESELPLCAGSELEAVFAPEPAAGAAGAAAALALALGSAARRDQPSVKPS